MVGTLVSIPGYHTTEELYNGLRTLVYRGYKKSNSLPVVIKLLKNPYPSFNELLQFRNQYTIAKNLNFPGIIQTYNLESYQNGYALIMEDFGGVPLKDYFTKRSIQDDAFLEEFLYIAISLCDILEKLYQERVIHKDIKPANILINPETKQVKLIDFSISSLLTRETQEIRNPNVLEGTLAYISPEQTGRMNRGVDYRSDFYSLGVTFYELLTGELPFLVNDPMELIHCHIAKMPTPLVGNGGEIPKVLSDIVMKLIEKNAEDRYQSALGIKHDLQHCLVQLQQTGTISPFTIGQRDVSDRFLIPERLYGRENEVMALLRVFNQVSEGSSEMMLVAGFSGIGKTAVVNEIHKPIVRQRGYFIKGKYDQFQRDIPFSAFVQAFRDLMVQLLSENDFQLANWKTKILAAVGENGQVLVDVIPELERIIGKQPPVVELSGSAAQNRFNLLFQKFIQIFTTPNHPLVIFLDDLQWADSASLNLLKLLMSEAKTGYLLILGAYRDNEVFAAHPLMLTLEQLQKAQSIVNTIILAPLEETTVNQLVADTLICTPELAEPLTQLVYQKTKGNPFFTTQFLKALHEDGWIHFTPPTPETIGGWQCNIIAVRQLALTDDVVEFMALQLQKLSKQTQEILKLAACIGNSFDLNALAIVSERSKTEVAIALWKALQEGFVLPQSEVYKFYIGQAQPEQIPTLNTQRTVFNYRFLHDRVQQAAYSLIPNSHKQAAHLKVGQLLLNNTSSQAIEASIFDIVNQFNKASEIISQQSEKNQIAQLNLIAGRKAKVSTAYKAAVEYFKLGLELLAEDSWSTHYQLTFGLYRERAECEYLIGNLKQAENLFDLALSQAQDKFEKADIYEIQMYLKMTQGENIQVSYEPGLKGLSIMGIHLPSTPEEQQAAIAMLLDEIDTKLKTICASDLFELPKMTDPHQKVCMSLLADLWAATYMGGDLSLSFLSLLLMLKTSLTHGNAEASGFAYCLYGMSLASQGDYQTAYEFGTLALKLDRQFNSTKFIYKTNNIFAHTINPYNQHLKTNLPISRQSFQASQEGGDVVFGVWAVSFLIWAMLIKGDLLPDVYAETEKYLSYVQQVNDPNMLYAFILQRQFLLNLQDASQPTDLLGDCDRENEQDLPYIEIWRQKKNFEHGINWYCFLKLQLSYLYGQYTDAVAAAKEAEPTLPTNAGFFPIILYHFYYPLSLAALYPTATREEKNQYWDVLQQHHQIIKKWATCCPENFLHRDLLLSAEIVSISSQSLTALDLYDRAIDAAKTNEYIQEEALANELAAKFCLNWGKEKFAAVYMQSAYYCYAKWGAKAKTSDLEKRYPQLLKPILEQRKLNFTPWETITTNVFQGISLGTRTSTNNSISDALDLTSVLEAAQTISSSIELDELVARLTKIILENSGAKKSVLILPEENTWQVRAITSINSQNNSSEQIQTSLEPKLLDTCQDIPQKLINYVKNTQETIVIDNCQTDIPGVIGKYMLEYQPKSVLCKPIIHQGRLVGILYLENQQTTRIFTNERLEVINLLSSQAAISLENARLYQKSQQALKDLQQAQLQIIQSEKMSALGNLVAGVAHEMNNPLGFISASLQQAQPTFVEIAEHLKLYQQTFPNQTEEILDHAESIDLEYSLEDFPKMLDSMTMACDRLKNISTSLRTFSRADRDYKVPFNIHEGIDSTILILKHRLKANEQRPAIEVVTNYGNFPPIECFPGQLNQVFMNVIANAIDAIDESNLGLSWTDIQAYPNRITITTNLADDFVKITIADNGKGMTEEIQQKIFDRLFTTKAVGKGTGLGLAIAKQIVESIHGGKLYCHSILNEGTEFIIEL